MKYVSIDRYTKQALTENNLSKTAMNLHMKKALVHVSISV